MQINHILWTFLMLIVIGALIGGMTNALAIKMLFRPYQPKFIGKWRVPFTPGLIPKRRQELSEQLGDMVMSHLLTAEGIEKKLRDDDFIETVNNWGKRLVSEFVDQRTPIREQIEKFIEPDLLVGQLEEKTTEWIEQSFRTWMEDHEDQSLEDLIPEKINNRMMTFIPQLVSYIIDNLTQYMESDEGKAKLKEQVDSFFSGRGMFGNMLQFVLGNQSLMDRFHPEIIKFIQRDEFHSVLITMIENEWGKFKGKSLEEVAETVHLSEGVNYVIHQVIQERLPYASWLNMTMTDLFGPYRSQLLDNVIPKVSSMALSMLATRITSILKALHLEEVVKHEVDAFSVGRLEEIVLMISKREFKMITYLGALLGAIIGLCQGIVIILIG